MTLNYYNSKPTVALIGANRRGKYVVFTTFGIKVCEGEGADRQYEGYGAKFELIALDIQELFQQIEPEYILMASEEELADLMRIFKADDNIDAWCALRTLQINAYDRSDCVNGFMFNKQKYWLDKDTRVGLANMYRLSSQWNKDKVPPLWIGSTPVDVGSSEKALELLAKIEQYALQCYSITQRHLVAIENARQTNDINVLRDFNITDGYPQPIVIEF